MRIDGSDGGVLQWFVKSGMPVDEELVIKLRAELIEAEARKQAARQEILSRARAVD